MAQQKDQGVTKKASMPEGVTASLEDTLLTIEGPAGEVSRDFFSPLLNITIDDNIVELSIKSSKRKFTKILNTMIAHVNNMVKGAVDSFTYEVKICSGHFPMSIKKDESMITISNFLGEKIPRKSKILRNVNVEVKGDMITIKSPDIESAGQTAANLEHATKIKNRDRRIFQDGCYIISKPKTK